MRIILKTLLFSLAVASIPSAMAAPNSPTEEAAVSVNYKNNRYPLLQRLITVEARKRKAE